MRHDCGEVDTLELGADAEGRRPADEVPDAGRLDEGLRGDAAVPGALAAETSRLDEEDVPTLCGDRLGGGEPRGTPADDGDVEAASAHEGL